jgi:hypothetical protein
MPSSLSCAEERENSAFHEGIFDACWLKLRPMTVRKVCMSGTNGVGRGIRVAFTWVCKHRACGVIRDRVQGRRKDGMDRNCGALTIIVANTLYLVSRHRQLGECVDLPSLGTVLSSKGAVLKTNLVSSFAVKFNV